MAKAEFEYTPPQAGERWRHSCEDCGRGVDPPRTVCPLCLRVRIIESKIMNIDVLVAGITADLAALKRVVAPGAGGIQVPVLTGQVKLR